MERRGIQTTAGELWREVSEKLEAARDLVVSLRESLSRSVERVLTPDPSHGLSEALAGLTQRRVESRPKEGLAGMLDKLKQSRQSGPSLLDGQKKAREAVRRVGEERRRLEREQKLEIERQAKAEQELEVQRKLEVRLRPKGPSPGM